MPLSGDERQHIRQLIDQAGGADNPSGWFEPLYRQAQGDPNHVPWANLTANPHLLEWLETSDLTPTPDGDRRSALVIGCGLGDDAEVLACAGYTVTAFDISETAIAWCQRRFPNSTVTYEVGDMFAPRADWTHHFNLVFECRNFQALPIGIRDQAMIAIAHCVAPSGLLLMITNYREQEALPDGPPWPLSEGELNLFSQHGLSEQARQHFLPSSDQGHAKIRLVLSRHST